MSSAQKNNQSTSKLISHCLIFLIFGLLNLNLQARIISVNGSNTPSQLSINATAQSQIVWSVVEEENAIGQATIRSSGGTFFDPQQRTIIGRMPAILNQTRTLLARNTTFTFRETLIIPQTIIRRAQQQGLNQLIYVRSFTDSSGTPDVSNFVSFSISTGSVASELGLRRVQMEFDDGRTSAIIKPNTKIQARAIISYVGTGLLEYSWEIASPPSTQGRSIFTPLISRRQYLLAGGQVSIQSPVLPSLKQGVYLLRINIHKPEPQFDMPTLRYIVNKSANSIDVTNVEKIRVSTPSEDAFLSPDTEFNWKPIAGAKAYQLELYARPIRNDELIGSQKQPPITGVLIPANNTSSKVGSLSRTHLMTGTTYYWRVIALSDDGQVIGRSEYRSIRF